MYRPFFVAVMIALLPSLTSAQSLPTPTTPATQVVPQPLPTLFSDKERAAIIAYWNAPGRYSFSAPSDVATDGPYRVRLTPEGSQWLLTYQRTVAGKAKLPPTADARPKSGPYAEWEVWVSARLAYDRYMAQQAADAMNLPLIAAKDTTPSRGLLASRGGKAASRGSQANDTPPPPGPIPTALLLACGNPPSFAGVVTPMQYQVHFDDPDETYTYTDNVKLRDRYAYYRFPRGVVSYGARLKDMTPLERDELFRAGGFSPAEQRIYCAVSGLEGGFETVQTYDTGFVSVGFIQFVTLAEGKHDLSEVLLTMKESRPEEYEKDFRQFGIDVQADKTLTVVDPATGAELTGNAAVLKIIDDKRLTAVFQRAGRHPGFRIAQIKVAKSFYWPTNDMVNLTLPDGTILSGKVGDCVKSEAGLACLLDRKINTGNIRLLNDVALRVATTRNCKTITDLALYEQEIIAAMKYRADFLADASLGQPTPPPSSVKPLPTDSKTPVVDAKNPLPPPPPPAEADTSAVNLPKKR